MSKITEDMMRPAFPQKPIKLGETVGHTPTGMSKIELAATLRLLAHGSIPPLNGQSSTTKNRYDVAVDEAVELLAAVRRREQKDKDY